MQKTILMIVAVALVGCVTTSEPTKTVPEKLIADPIVEKAIREALKKPTGELTKTDLVKVTSLNLQNDAVTDKGLKEVAKLKSLTMLNLFNCKQFTDDGLKEVAKLKNLTEIYLGSSKITDAGLKEVAKLGKLNTLSVDYIPITDAGLKEVAKLTKLTKLSLYLSRPSKQSGLIITIAGYKEITKLKNLTRLDLGYHRITDFGLKELAKLKNLTSLNLNFCTQISKAGVAELKKALPKCKIDSNRAK